MKGLFNTAQFNKIIFNKPYLYSTAKTETIIRGANRTTNLNTIRQILLGKVEDIIRGASRNTTLGICVNFLVNKVENIIRGASRDIAFNATRFTFITKTENILVGAGRKAYYYIHRRVSKLKSIIREQSIRFRVKRGL